MSISLKEPPVKDLVFNLLVERYNSELQSLKFLEEGNSGHTVNMTIFNVMFGNIFEETHDEENGVVSSLRQLEEEILEFENGETILDKIQLAYVMDDVVDTTTPTSSEVSLQNDSDRVTSSPARTTDSVSIVTPSDPPQRQEPVRLDTLFDTTVVGAHPVNIGDIKLDDIIIVVMGPTGTGKTTFVNSVAGTTGNGLDMGHRLDYGTTNVSCTRIAIPGTHSTLVLVDTPGFDDPERTDAQVLEVIAKWLELIYRRRVLITGLVYLHRITDIRHDVGIQNTMNVFQRLSGPNAFERVALVSTMWNDLRDKQIGVEREEQLMNNHWRPMIIRKVMTGRFDSNNPEGAIKVIRGIVERNNKTVVLDLQNELVDKKKSLPATSAGKVAFTLEEAMKWRLRQLTGTLSR